MLYCFNPDMLRLTALKTYEKFVSTFGLRDGQKLLQRGVRSDAAGRPDQFDNDSRSQRPAAVKPGNAASDGSQGADRLQRLREIVLRVFGGPPAGKRVEFESADRGLKTSDPAQRATTTSAKRHSAGGAPFMTALVEAADTHRAPKVRRCLPPSR